MSADARNPDRVPSYELDKLEMRKRLTDVE